MKGKYHFDLRRPFERFDIGRSGMINRADFKTALANAGISISNGEMAYLRDRFTGEVDSLTTTVFANLQNAMS